MTVVALRIRDAPVALIVSCVSVVMTPPEEQGKPLVTMA